MEGSQEFDSICIQKPRDMKHETFFISSNFLAIRKAIWYYQYQRLSVSNKLILLLYSKYIQ
jgi:hypothetical protein